MKICGTVPVEVPECEGFYCPYDCKLEWCGCKFQVIINWVPNRKGRDCYNNIPGSYTDPKTGIKTTCPAHDTVPNPWSDVPGYEDRPEAERRDHKAAPDKAWEEKPIGPCPECGRDAWVNKWNIWYCDACGKAHP